MYTLKQRVVCNLKDIYYEHSSSLHDGSKEMVVQSGTLAKKDDDVVLRHVFVRKGVQDHRIRKYYGSGMSGWQPANDN